MIPASSIATAPGALPLLGHLVPLLRDPLGFLTWVLTEDLRPDRRQPELLAERIELPRSGRALVGSPEMIDEAREHLR